MFPQEDCATLEFAPMLSRPHGAPGAVVSNEPVAEGADTPASLTERFRKAGLAAPCPFVATKPTYPGRPWGSSTRWPFGSSWPSASGIMGLPSTVTCSMHSTGIAAPQPRSETRAVCHSPGVDESPWICCIQIPVRQPSARCTDSVSQKDSTGQRWEMVGKSSTKKLEAFSAPKMKPAEQKSSPAPSLTGCTKSKEAVKSWYPPAAGARDVWGSGGCPCPGQGSAWRARRGGRWVSMSRAGGGVLRTFGVEGEGVVLAADVGERAVVVLLVRARVAGDGRGEATLRGRDPFPAGEGPAVAAEGRGQRLLGAQRGGSDGRRQNQSYAGQERHPSLLWVGGALLAGSCMISSYEYS